MADFLATITNAARQKQMLNSVDNRGGWFPWVREPYAGAWQKNDEWTTECVLAYHAVYACITLISADIGKLRITLQKQDTNGIWEEADSPSFSPVLKKPNGYQNHIQFKEWWITSKLIRGNTYVLKERDARGIVVRLYILDPCRVTPLVATDGSVFYQLGQYELGGIDQTMLTVPASEIIHDRMNCLFHPLVGVSPLFASGMAASQGLKIQTDSGKFFENGANPGGILTAPGAISDETAARLKLHWDTNYTGKNAGKVAVAGDGLKFEPLRMSAVDSQLIEQLRWTAEVVCSTFHVPAYKVGVGQPPSVNNIDALGQDYYSQCLQTLIENFELCLDEGLALPAKYRIYLDLDGLFRMDSKTRMETLGLGVDKALMTPNEGRRALNLAPLTGGNTVYMQQQNYSMEALSKRDSKPDPFATGTSNAPAPTATENTDDSEEDQAKMLALLIEKEMAGDAQTA